MTATRATKPYVGTANRMPASRTPRRFASVTNSTRPIAMMTRCWASDGAAEVMAIVPAVMLTATVST